MGQGIRPAILSIRGIRIQMKKAIVKIICFVGIFIILFSTASSFIGLKWSKGEMMKERYDAFAREESVDVVYVGASNIYASICPTVVWKEEGITGFNLSVSSVNMMLIYYQLQYALKVHKPSLVVLDVTGLNYKMNPTGANEGTFQKMMASLPDFTLRMKLMRDMCREWDDVKPSRFLFPLLRYHERWEELTEEDFDPSTSLVKYKAFGKGCFIRSKIDRQKNSGSIFKHTTTEVSESNMSYLNKIYDLCADNHIQLMLVSSPNMASQELDYTTARQFAEEKDLHYLVFPSVEEIKKAGIDPSHDFYNPNHLNIFGQKKYSALVASYIREHYEIEDHRGDAALSGKWNKVYETYEAYHDKCYKRMLEREKEQ